MHDASVAAEGDQNEQTAWPGAIAAITLFVEDLAAAKRFYREVFRLPVTFEDDNSAVFTFGQTMINLLDAKEAPGLIEPAHVADADAGVQIPVHARASTTSTRCVRSSDNAASSC